MNINGYSKEEVEQSEAVQEAASRVDALDDTRITGNTAITLYRLAAIGGAAKDSETAIMVCLDLFPDKKQINDNVREVLGACATNIAQGTCQKLTPSK